MPEDSLAEDIPKLVLIQSLVISVEPGWAPVRFRNIKYQMDIVCVFLAQNTEK